jgi:hypothetical protein
MNKTELDLLESLVRHEGWTLYKSLLKDEFDRIYSKLRDSRRSDVSYGKLCGKLDGIEYSQDVIDNKINEGVDEPQPE